MQKNKLKRTEFENWKLYRKQGTKFNRCRVNQITIQMNNGLEHEICKLKTCYELKGLGVNFITEAEEITTGERPDIVKLSNNEHIEIETCKQRAKRFEGKDNVTVIKLFEQ